MKEAQIREMKDELDSAAMNMRELLQRHANALIAAGTTDMAGRCLVFERIVMQQAGHLLHYYAAAVAMAEPAPAPAKRAGRGAQPAASHRHKFNADGVCELPGCGAKRQRAPKGSGGKPAERPSAEARTGTIPFTGLGRGTPPAPDDDEFAGGTMGSSSATERRR